MKKDIEEKGVALTEPEVIIVNYLIKDASDTVHSLLKNSVQYILWEEQKKFNVLKDKCQMRWHSLVIRFALSLEYVSTAAFQQVVKLGSIVVVTLREDSMRLYSLVHHKNWCTIKTGVQAPFID